jgi:hypothetical protein
MNHVPRPLRRLLVFSTSSALARLAVATAAFARIVNDIGVARLRRPHTSSTT